MVEFLTKLLLVARSRLKSQARPEAENTVLRQQVIVLSRKSPSRVWLRNIDRLIFVGGDRSCSVVIGSRLAAISNGSISPTNF